jgi:hypothetical protein
MDNACFAFAFHYEYMWGMQQHSWLSHYIFPAVGPGVYLASNGNGYQKQQKIFMWSRAQLAPEADNPTALCEPIV